MTNSAIYEWRPSGGHHNFGDHLMWLIGERVFQCREWERLKADPNHHFVLLGSCISDYSLEMLAHGGRTPVLLGCGYRGEPLSDVRLAETLVIGCRGHATRAALKKHGIDAEVIGDPAMILPLLIAGCNSPQRKSILMPHVCDEFRTSYTTDDVECDLVLQPETHGISELIDIVRAISCAEFVLAGAMHAAIVAHAYGVPFAFFRQHDGYLDCPPKWADWLTSIGADVEPEFFDNCHDGRRWYARQRDRLGITAYGPILNAYARIGRVRTALVFKAFVRDVMVALAA